MHRRQATGLLAISACLFGLPVGPPPAAAAFAAPAVTAESTSRSAAASFTILHVNDVYRIEGLEQGARGGFPRLRTLRRELEAAGPVLMLHGGDFLFPSVIGKYLKGHPMIEAMNRLDGDDNAFDPRLFTTFGNHEFDDKDPGVVLGRMAQSDFTWLSANVSYKTAADAPAESFSTRVTRLAPHRVLDIGGVRVGLFGLTLEDERAPWLQYSADPTWPSLVRRTLDSLKAEGAEFVVALTHLNLEQDQALAQMFPEIGLICGGHEHLAMDQVVTHASGQTRIVKADADAITAAVITVERRGTQAEPAFAVRAEWRPLDSSVLPDAAMTRTVNASMEKLSQAILRSTGKTWDTLFGTTEHALEGLEPKIRTRETALGNFLADALRDRFKTDLGFVNGGAVRINDDIPANGAIRAYELEGIFYFPNRGVAFEITGQELLEVLQTSVERAEIGEGRFLQVSGLRFRFRPIPGSGEPPTRRFTLDAADVEIGTVQTGFVPLDLKRRYAVASLDYIWEYGYRDGYALFSKGNNGSSPPRLDKESPPWRTLTEDAILALPDKRVRTAIEGRITKVEN